MTTLKLSESVKSREDAALHRPQYPIWVDVMY